MQVLNMTSKIPAEYLGMIIPPVHKQHGVKVEGVTLHFNHHAISSLVTRIELLIKCHKLPGMSSAI